MELKKTLAFFKYSAVFDQKKAKFLEKRLSPSLKLCYSIIFFDVKEDRLEF